MDIDRNYFVYMVTNKKKTTLYTGITNYVAKRLSSHYNDCMGDQRTFAGKYHCFNLVYYESFRNPSEAIARESEIKGWTRAKKEALINEFNPEWKFLNDDFV